MTIRQSEVLRGAAHFAKVAGRAAPKLKGKDVRAAIRTEVESEVMDGAAATDLRADISAQRDRFAGCVRHRDQVRGVVREAAGPVVDPATLRDAVAAGQAALAPPRREVRTVAMPKHYTSGFVR